MEFDHIDAVADVLTEFEQTPSALARTAHISTTDAYGALRWLTENRMAVAVGNGCLTKYRQRRFGEK